jgi:lysophospholipase L1-like esterase
MALKLDNRPGQVYDPEEESRRVPSTPPDDGLENAWRQPEYKSKKDKQEPDVASAERNASSDDGQQSGYSEGEEPIPNETNGSLGKGYTGGSKKSKSVVTKKRLGIGGGAFGLGAIVVTLLMGFTSSLYLVHVKEGLTGEGNKVSNTIGTYMQKRRLNTFGTIIQKGAQNLQTDKLTRKLTSEGFEVVAERGAIRSISKGGVELVFDGSTKSIVQQVNSLGQSLAGREFISSFDNVAKEGISRFAGVVTRKKVYQKLGMLALIDWIGAYRVRAGPEAVDGKQPRAVFSQAFTRSDETIKEVVSNASLADLERLGLDPEDIPDGTFVDNIGQETADGANQLREETLNNGGEKVLVAGEDQIDNAIGSGVEAAAGLVPGIGATDEIGQTFARKVGGKIGSTALTAVAGGIDLTSLHRQGCRVKGTLQFIKNVRNTLMAIELAKFALKFYTIADHQKAGLIESSSIKLMALYLAGSTGSGGMQWALNAGKGAVSAEGLAKYGVGYADVGILSAISTFLGSVPGLGVDSCKFVNNPLTQVAGTIAGGLLAVFTLTGSVQVSIPVSVGLTIANELAFAIGTPLLIRSVAGLVVDGWESQFNAGDALAAGDGVFKSQTAGANGGLPVSNDLFALQSNEATAIYQEKLAKQSIVDRYLNVAKADSLLGKISISMPMTLPQLGDGIVKIATNTIPSSTKIVTNTLNPFDNQVASAAGSDQCEDSAAIEYNIATDPFCSPIMSYVPVLDLDQTEAVLRDEGQIDLQGQPIDEFEVFVENCFSGRTGMLHPAEISRDGESEENDDTCVVGTSDDSFAGDIEETFVGFNTPDNRSFVQKIFTPRASAQTPDVNRIPTKKERFAAWYGYLADQDNMLGQINDELAEIGFENPQLVNSNVFVLGDSLTVGMQNLAGTDDGGGNYLQRELSARGWSPTVDAQGCRSVYQSAGAIVGDGSSCPRTTIYDGISTINNPTNQQAVRSAGTFVIALGTNGGETGDSGSTSTDVFRDKSAELIDRIKEYNPSANIYWLNLRFRNETPREVERNAIINDLVSEKGIRLMDWDTHVNTLSSNNDFSDDVSFATYADGTLDNVHHDARGYRIKTSFLVNSLGSPSPNVNETTIITGQPTDNIPCGAGTDRGVADGYEDGVLTKIRICDVQGTIVNSQIAANIDQMYTEARAAGAALSGDGFRTMAAQQGGWASRCGVNYPQTSRWASPPCRGAQLARPGFSNHQMGMAIDLRCNGAAGVISSTTDTCFIWLENNAARFGFYEWGNDEQLPVSPSRNRGGYEPWHWSVNGN